ncbi:FRG domain-containing protein [Vibrio parahaemolyticus]|uniref:FRG domain-containing protein n=1 Tax=Vibrio parahaemolyticus TaxID=670 RepID=UPI0004136E53|nr:FRG domain-containing protein [Vibrio parahaemolyticus]HAS7010777.1 FRG domain-containing protein [Vibrio parahaemolyticus]HCE2651566.1 FRG domain-containing protein [Vibrio parahaemolyticus]HCE5036197.1 FRG domain-containing protein [Vibrio parahaemolyticus]HCG8974455.1 FRG domain-containing protein [Vibrio parahaemolyticus]HCG9764986.1 FRG domain-containing protein [Vibrio parahaemolyticus]
MVTEKWSQVDKAFAFFKERREAKSSFQLEELAEDTGWSLSTVRTYLKKKWSKLLIEDSGQYSVTDLIEALDQDGFRKHQSQIIEVNNRLKRSSLDDHTPIGSVRTFLGEIEKLNPVGELYYRGQGYFGFEAQPSIYRNGGLIDNEHRMYREIITKCPNDFQDAKSTFEHLVKMQHYFLPSRLLDITKNPLIALFFACNSEDGDDGEIIIYDFEPDDIKFYDSDTVSVISNIARRPPNFTIDTIRSKSKEAFNSESEIQLLLHEIKEEKPYFKSIIDAKHLESVVCVKPKLDNPRIIKQEGAFLLFGINGNKKCCANFSQNKQVLIDSKRLIVMRENKQKILEQLASLGIMKSTIYPEIEHVAIQMKSKYETE